MHDFRVVLGGELVDGKELLLGVEGEMSSVVVSEIPRLCSVVDDEELDETEKRLGVAVSGIVLVIHDLPHRPPGADSKCLQFDLDDGDTVDQEDDVVTVVAVVGVDPKLIDDFKAVLAPVLDVDERVVERSAVVPDERLAVSQGACGFVHVRRDDFVEKSLELTFADREGGVECNLDRRREVKTGCTSRRSAGPLVAADDAA